MLVLFIIIWVSIGAIFLTAFYKADFDFEDTFILLKRWTRLSKESISSDEVVVVKETEKERYIDKVDAVLGIEEEEDCKTLAGFPLDLCVDDLNDSDRKIRENVMKKIRTEPVYFEEMNRDGSISKKLVAPLEILMFLNKELNPLVNEHGEILLSAKEEKVVGDIKAIIMELKSTKEIIYESDEEIVSAIIGLLEISRKHGVSFEEIGKAFTDKLSDSPSNKKVEEKPEEPKPEKKPEEPKPEKKPEEPKPEKKPEEPKPEKKPEEPKPEKKPEDPKPEKKLEEPKPEKKPEEPKPEKKPEEPKPKQKRPQPRARKEMDSLEEDLDDLLEGEELSDEDIDVDGLSLPIMDIEIPSDKGAEDDSENIKTFLSAKHWQNVESASINWRDMNETLKNIFEGAGMSALANNISKQTPLVFNDNKVAVFIDIQIIYVAFARLFGVDYQTVISKLRKMPKAIQNKFNSGLEHALEQYLTDIVSGRKGVTHEYFTEGTDSFKGIGVWVTFDFFRECFKDEDLDFFRSYPYNPEISLGQNKQNCSPLVQDIGSTEI